MVKITGTLHTKTGFVRLKPNINFIGATLGISVYDLSKPLKIELNPTPMEGLYLVDYCLTPNAAFLPTEHWMIPSNDCTFDELRGIKQSTSDLTKALENRITVLEKENQGLKEVNEDLIKQQQEFSAYTRGLEQKVATLEKEISLKKSRENVINQYDQNSSNQEINIEVNSSLEILRRFS
jgi:vacuolar-type H+-ATPase subunit I/STV1